MSKEQFRDGRSRSVVRSTTKLDQIQNRCRALWHLRRDDNWTREELEVLDQAYILIMSLRPDLNETRWSQHD